jgi:hypothetical protein
MNKCIGHRVHEYLREPLAVVEHGFKDIQDMWGAKPEFANNWRGVAIA